jgi:hypothetical protein
VTPKTALVPHLATTGRRRDGATDTEPVPPSAARRPGPVDAGRDRALTRTAATGVPATLAAIAALHAAWALGWRWPGGSDRALAETVVGPGAELPPPAAAWAVSGSLALAAGLVAAAARPGAGRLVRVGAKAVAGALLLRGAAGPVGDLAGGLDGRYERLDLLLYSPLCLTLGAGAALVARDGERAAART